MIGMYYYVIIMIFKKLNFIHRVKNITWVVIAKTMNFRVSNAYKILKLQNFLLNWRNS